MRPADHLRFALTSLWKRKLRTFLTASGVMIGIGALVAMVSFGRGMQKNVTESFRSLELFNTLTVLPGNAARAEPRGRGEGRLPGPPAAATVGAGSILDEAAAARIAGLAGVESAFPDIRLPALVRLDGNEELRFVQVVPASIAGSESIRFAAGRAYGSDDDEAVIISASLLKDLGVDDPGSAIGRKLSLSTVGLDFSNFDLADPMASLAGQKLPFSTEERGMTIAGVSEVSPFGSSGPLQSDLFLPAGTARRINRLPFSSIWDLFRAGRGGGLGYSALNVRLQSIQALEPVKKEVKAMGFGTFALADQFREIRRGFLMMDMVLAAVGMIAIVVASLGIINTMVMSILERYSEIGVMKALGARDRDVRRIFLVESGVIGVLGGVAGLALAAVVSGLVNRIINYFLAKQGVPYIDYFDFSWWLGLAALAFSAAVSLAAGVYPAMRAVRVDPVRALRHE